MDLSPNMLEIIPAKVKIKLPVSFRDGVDNGSGKPDERATRSKTFYQNGAPTGDYKSGDIWVDTNDNNHTYRANDALAWVSVRDGTIAGKGTIFRQDSVPTALAAGDLWFDSNDGDKCYRATAAGDNQIGGGEWIRVDVGANPSLVDVLSTTNAPADAGATDDTTADTKAKIFRQAGVPTAVSAGDIWFDSDDNDKAYRATNAGDDEVTAGEWVNVDSDWANLQDGGSNKPANGATVGATFGSDIAGGGSGNTQVGNDGYVSLVRETAFGDGSDGSLTTSGDVTLTSDMHYTNLTISTGDVFYTAGYRIFCTGTISRVGTGKISLTGGAGGHASGATAGAAGAAAAGNALPEGKAGKAGATGGGGVGTAGTAGESAVKGIVDNAKQGGNGGAGVSAGGVGGNPGVNSGTIYNYPRNYASACLLIDAPSSNTVLEATNGSGSGGAGGGDTTGGTGGGGGGSGGAGGMVWIAAKTFAADFEIDVSGGAGGNGGNGQSGVGNTGGGGGGAGGSGGVAILIYQTIGTKTVTVSGGAGGTAGTGASGGNNGTNGNAGGAGSEFNIQI